MTSRRVNSSIRDFFVIEKQKPKPKSQTPFYALTCTPAASPAAMPHTRGIPHTSYPGLVARHKCVSHSLSSSLS